MGSKRNTGNYIPMGSKRKEVIPAPETSPEAEEPRSPPVVYDPVPEPPPGPLHPLPLSIGEMIGAATVLYASSIAAFNAGYFYALKGHFLELFSLTDLVAINLAIVQYFFF